MVLDTQSLSEGVVADGVIKDGSKVSEGDALASETEEVVKPVEEQPTEI